MLCCALLFCRALVVALPRRREIGPTFSCHHLLPPCDIYNGHAPALTASTFLSINQSIILILPTLQPPLSSLRLSPTLSLVTSHTRLTRTTNQHRQKAGQSQKSNQQPAVRLGPVFQTSTKEKRRKTRVSHLSRLFALASSLTLPNTAHF